LSVISRPEYDVGIEMMLDARLKRRGPDREIAVAGRAEPVHGVGLEIVDDRLGRR
jgi:hypothetical protein